MDDVDTGASAIFDFMSIRAPEPVPEAMLRRAYILDGDFVFPQPVTHVPQEPSIENYSAVGAVVTKHVFAESSVQDPMAALVDELLAQIKPVVIGADGVTVADLDSHAVIMWKGNRYLLPSRLADIEAALLNGLRAFRIPVGADPAGSAGALRTIYGDDLSRVVFAVDGNGHKDDFVETVRKLFEALYLLYVLRRLVSIDLSDIITGLRVLHLLQACAIDEAYTRVQHAPQPDQRDLNILTTMASRYRNDAFPLVQKPGDVRALLAARPIVHPIFARLFGYRTPFNDLRPLGVGEFKVVKQTLLEYLPGEICDIHNVMKGEAKERVHRRLERSDETYSFNSSFEEETTKDSQSTDRFELKREVENTLKTDLNVTASANVRYDSKVVVATVGAGFAYNRSDGLIDKTAQNFSREVVTKAVSRVQTSTAEQRTVTKIFETEETNKHGFTSPDSHTSGIYRWLDKHYQAQLYNYGKRMMFEFVLPEPAALFVASRLRAFEAGLHYPEKPAEPVYETLQMPVAGPGDITPAEFDVLRRSYDLTAFSYPTINRTVSFVDTLSGASLIKEKDIDGSDKWWSKSLKCSFDGVIGYDLTKVFITGNIEFEDHNPSPAPTDRNMMRIEIDGTPIVDYEDPNIFVTVGDRVPFDPIQPYRFAHDGADVVLSFQDVKLINLMVSGELTLSAQYLLNWQTNVYNTVFKVEKAKLDERNRDIRMAHQAAMTNYTNAMSQLEQSILNDLLQGTSESANHEIICSELRRQVLVMMTKELGADATDDLLNTWNAMGEREVQHDVTRVDFDEQLANNTVTWQTRQVATSYPVPDRTLTQRKGSYIQFLEQAFEWDKLAYLFYPYFWATPPRWMELMTRSDDTDPTMTAFLRAGAVRVLVAVSPAYDDAVLHFLATREPWEGGPAPVIGDPLYLPLHEELRQQQDDLSGAEPVGEPWNFTVPTSLVYLHGSDSPLPDLIAERKARLERQP